MAIIIFVLCFDGIENEIKLGKTLKPSPNNTC